ncbi:MAG: hypothetical protein ACYCYM_09505 [Saccharofermentanales bacterium]
MKSKKLLIFLIAAVMLISQIAIISGAEESKIYFKTDMTDGSYGDGGYYAKGPDEILTPTGEHGIEMTGKFRCLWAFTNDVIEANPILYFKLADDASAIYKITVSKQWDVEPEIELTIKPGENVINIFELLSDQTTIGYTYVVVYVGDEGQEDIATGMIDYMYISNLGPDGKIYEKPVQPLVPDGDPSKEIRYQLEPFAEDTVDENGFGFMMSADCDITPEEKGFTMKRSDSSDAEAINIAWVVDYAQLETTPYLVFEIGNEGRADQGPRLVVYAYWEGVVGSFAKFDLIPVSIGANSLTGVNKMPLKYAVDGVPENSHGDKGIAIIFALQINDRTDGTSTEPLKVTDAYLLGYEEGGETTTSSESGSKTGSEAESQSSSLVTSVPVAGNEDSNLVIYIIIGSTVLAAAVVAIVIIAKKRKAKL